MTIEKMNKRRDDLKKQIADAERILSRVSRERDEMIGAIKILDELIKAETPEAPQ